MIHFIQIKCRPLPIDEGEGILRVASSSCELQVEMCELRVSVCEFNSTHTLRVASFSYLRVK